MTGSSWKHDRYINTQSACIRNTLESYVIFVFPDPSKRFPGSPCVIHCCGRVPHTAGTTEASRELDVEKWRAFIEKKINKWHEISNGFPVTDDSGWWWKSLFPTVECVKHLDKKLQGGHLKPFQTNWKRVWRHVSVSIYQIFASRLLPVTSHSDWIRSNLAVGESETLKQKHRVSVAVHVSLTTVPWSHLAAILVLHLHIIKGMLFNWRNIKHSLIRSRVFFFMKNECHSFYLHLINKKKSKII